MNGFLITQNYRQNHNRNPLYDFRREMDRLFDDFWTAPASNGAMTEHSWRPPCEIEETKDYYLLSFEMPGVPKDAIKIECSGNQLTVSGERTRETQRNEHNTWYTERSFGKFNRSFTLPSEANAENIEANYQDGILRLYVPKTEAAKPRQIKVSNGSGATGFFGRMLGQKSPETT